jgi:hypothetical protein
MSEETAAVKPAVKIVIPEGYVPARPYTHLTRKQREQRFSEDYDKKQSDKVVTMHLTTKSLLSPSAMNLNKDAFGQTSWGADAESLCRKNYVYVGHGNERYMAFMTDDCGRKVEGVFRFTGERDMTFRKAEPTDPLTLHVNPATKGLNLYYIPQTFKRKWISPEEYYALPEEERRNYRTDKTKGQKLYGACGFTTADILCYNEVVIDMDNHEDPTLWVQQNADKLVEAMDECTDDFVRPSFIVKTGRGLQMHYCITPVYAGGERIVRMLAKALIGYWKHMLKKMDWSLGEVDVPLVVDEGASMAIGGWKRLPGTYNWLAQDPETKQFGYLTRIVSETGEVFDVNALLQRLCVFVDDKEWRIHTWFMKHRAEEEAKCAFDALFVNEDGTAYTEEEPEKKVVSTFQKKKGRRDKPYHNKKRTESWSRAGMDLAKQITVGHRNQALFAVGCILRDGDVDTDAYLFDMNDAFAEPLPEREVERIERSVNIGRHHFSNVNAMEWCGFGPEKLKDYGLGVGGQFIPNEERHRAAVERREARNKEILEKIRTTGSISATARITNHCRITVRKVLTHFREAIARIRQRNLENATNLLRFISGLVNMASVFAEKHKPQLTYDPSLFIDVPLTS